jgi:uncharacterized protein (TIGR00661 family)
MKILYGVQATGNGHITRARALNKSFSQADDIQVDYLFSGRAKEDFWDMGDFGDWQCCSGLTFIHEAGDLKMIRTIRENKIRRFFSDVRKLDLDSYDLILTDFEPITAWAAKLRKKLCIGVGHQYAFSNKIPRRGADLISTATMKSFAPVSLGLGLHWHHFNGPILPPIAETHDTSEPSDPNKVVVYLGFENSDDVIEMLDSFDDHLFVYYGNFPQYESRGNIQLKPLSREGFKHDLATAGGVICNAGFELASEAIQLGKKLLVKPLHGQMEQLSNALALEELGLGMSMDYLDKSAVRDWLKKPEGKRVIYPNVAARIVEWVREGDWLNEESRSRMIEELWEQTVADDIDSFSRYPVPSLVDQDALLNKA